MLLSSLRNIYFLPGERIEAGELIITSDRLVICDPFVGINPQVLDHFTLSAEVNPGRYPVVLCRPRYPDGTFSSDCAYAILCLSDEIPSMWAVEPATNCLGEPLQFGVDSGTACFMDAQLNSELYKWLDLPSVNSSDEHKFRQDFWDPTISVMERNVATCGVDFANVHPPKLASNTITFGTGGDGWFEAYYGIDIEEEDGDEVVLAIAIDLWGYFSGMAYCDDDELTEDDFE